MASGHPVDELGRVLPEPTWSADKASPDRWDVIRRFCNTSNRESGADRFDTEAGLQRWTASEKIYGETASPQDVIRLVRFREHVRAHALAHHHRTEDAAIEASLADHVAGVQFTLAGEGGRLEVVPNAIGIVDQTIGTVSIAIMDAQVRPPGRGARRADARRWRHTRVTALHAASRSTGQGVHRRAAIPRNTAERTRFADTHDGWR